jgi:N-acetylneuraminic acid mutarotase
MARTLALLVLCLSACAPVFSGEDGGNLADAGWSVRAALPSARQETAVAALDGQLYVVGGIDAATRALDSVIRYDPATDTWSTEPSLPIPVHHANLAALGGRLWIVGALRDPDFMAHAAVWSWAPGEASWSTHAQLPPTTERGASGVAVVGTRIYVLGGFRGQSVTDASSYDTATDTHQQLPPLPVAVS